MLDLPEKTDYAPSNEDAALATVALERISAFIKKQKYQSAVPMEALASLKQVSLPVGALEMLLEVLHQAAQGHSVTVLPSDKEFSTQEAAGLLNVSRPFVIKLLEEGKIPFRKVGSHRRIKTRDLMSYKQAMEKEQQSLFEDLAKEAQELNLGYDTDGK